MNTRGMGNRLAKLERQLLPVVYCVRVEYVDALTGATELAETITVLRTGTLIEKPDGKRKWIPRDVLGRLVDTDSARGADENEGDEQR